MGRRRRKHKFKPINSIGIPSAEAAAFPPWIELPSDLTANILHRLGAVEILGSAQKVCATWWNLCKDPAMWRVINIINPDGPKPMNRGECTNMCRRAVDRSQGQLIDLTMAYFGRDELLDYIILRSRHLRRLTLACCYEISTSALVKAIKRVPELEELHLALPYIRAADIETIGISCPMLKSFTLNDLWWKQRQRMHRWFPENAEALAIAKSMPNLQHLRILGNSLDNEGLQAILDSCPYIESLVLRYCFGVDLVGALGIRCEQIQHLRLPSDLVDDGCDAREFFFFPSSDYCFSDWEDWDIYDYEFYQDYSDCEDWVIYEYDYEFYRDYYCCTGYDIDYYDDHDVVLW